MEFGCLGHWRLPVCTCRPKGDIMLSVKRSIDDMTQVIFCLVPNETFSWHRNFGSSAGVAGWLAVVLAENENTGYACLAWRNMTWTKQFDGGQLFPSLNKTPKVLGTARFGQASNL
jgi:hypothetical protein